MRKVDGTVLQAFNLHDILAFPANTFVSLRGVLALRVVDASGYHTFVVKDAEGNESIESVLPLGVTVIPTKWREIKFTEDKVLHVMYI